MATTNLINVDTITFVVNVGAVTTSRADIVDVTVEYCVKINSLIIANIDGTNVCFRYYSRSEYRQRFKLCKNCEYDFCC